MKPYEQGPYKGLAPYSEEDAQYFFGRERECKVIIANSMASRLTLLYGASGVGKSSLLRAGMGHSLEVLSRENLVRLGTPEFIGITFNSWRDDPVSSLLAHVRESIERLLPTAKDLSSTEYASLAESLQAYSENADATLLITLDQFEEYFLYHPQEAGKSTFAAEFIRAVNSPGSAANFLISIREDALAKLDRFRQGIPNLFENYLRLDHMDSDAARAAIENPIHRFNVLHPSDGPPFKIEPGLVGEILKQVSTQQPLFSGRGLGVVANQSREQRIETPYLQMVMTRLWDEEWRTGSRELRIHTLTNLGGAKKIVETNLDSAMTKLSIDEQRIAASIFNFLVTPSGTKIAHTAADLAAYSKQPQTKVAEILEKIASGGIRLLRTVPPPPDNPAADSRYEIFHDVLAPSVLDWRTRFEQKEAALKIIRKDVNPVPDSEDSSKLRPEIALSLSGGGYRSMLFHLGAIWRLNELGMLRKIARVSSVSAASITAGMLGLQWRNLLFDGADVATNFELLVVKPILRLAHNTIDSTTVLRGMLLPSSNAIEKLVDEYRKDLYGDASLQDLPSENEGPRFIINATNVSTGVLWRFSKPYMGDYRVGLIKNPNVELAVAVAASGASLPFHSPLELKLQPSDFEPGSGMDLQVEPYTSNVHLTDGGVYDKLALETVWKQFETILISDGGAARVDEPNARQNWLTHSYRIMSLMDHQVEALRKRQVISSYQMGVRKGTYWFIGSDIRNYNLADALPCPFQKTLPLAQIATRLKKLDATVQQQIINWGYAVCDASIRTHVDQNAPAPAGFPYPEAGVG